MAPGPALTVSPCSLPPGTRLCLAKAKAPAPDATCSPGTLAHCFPACFPSSLGASRDGLRVEHPLDSLGGHPPGHPHLCSAFVLLLRRVWMLSAYCPGARELAAGRGRGFAGASCPPPPAALSCAVGRLLQHCWRMGKARGRRCFSMVGERIFPPKQEMVSVPLELGTSLGSLRRTRQAGIGGTLPPPGHSVQSTRPRGAGWSGTSTQLLLSLWWEMGGRSPGRPHRSPGAHGSPLPCIFLSWEKTGGEGELAPTHPLDPKAIPSAGRPGLSCGCSHHLGAVFHPGPSLGS